MRNSPWTLLALSASILTLGYAALYLPTFHGGSGERESAWDLLLAWHRTGSPHVAAVVHPSGLEEARDGLQQGLQVRMLALDQEGQPIPSAVVRCFLLTDHSVGLVADGRTDDGGRFDSPDLHPGNYEVRVEAEGFLESSTTTLVLPRDGGKVHSLQLQAGCLVSGVLDGTDGVPRNHGVLRLVSLEDPVASQEDSASPAEDAATWFAEPDSEGNFRFPTVPQGDYLISWSRHRSVEPAPAMQLGIDCLAGQRQRYRVRLLSRDARVQEPVDGMGIGVHALLEE